MEDGQDHGELANVVAKFLRGQNLELITIKVVRKHVAETLPNVTFSKQAIKDIVQELINNMSLTKSDDQNSVADGASDVEETVSRSSNVIPKSTGRKDDKAREKNKGPNKGNDRSGVTSKAVTAKGTAGKRSVAKSSGDVSTKKKAGNTGKSVALSPAEKHVMKLKKLVIDTGIRKSMISLRFPRLKDDHAAVAAKLTSMLREYGVDPSRRYTKPMLQKMKAKIEVRLDMEELAGDAHTPADRRKELQRRGRLVSGGGGSRSSPPHDDEDSVDDDDDDDDEAEGDDATESPQGKKKRPRVAVIEDEESSSD